MLLVSCEVVGVWLCWCGLIVGVFGCFDLLVGWILLVAFEFLVECLCGCLVLSLSLGLLVFRRICVCCCLRPVGLQVCGWCV